jgi:hypothetical protein
MESIPCIFYPLASSLNVVNGNANMSETTVRLIIAVYGFVIWIVLGAIVVSQFNYALPIGPMIPMRHSLGRVVCQEIEIKLGIRVLQCINYFHSEELVEPNRSLRIFDS